MPAWASDQSVRDRVHDPVVLAEVLPPAVAAVLFAVSAPPAGPVVSTRTVVARDALLPTLSIPVRR
jgi:hypothetical protein